MNGKVDKLYDIDSIAIPEELLKVSVDEQRIEEEVAMLSLRYAKESLADTAAESDLVYAKADQESYPDGRTILLYTAMNMPGAEEAAKAVIGKKAGDVVSAVLADKKVTLTVEKVLHREPVEVTDELMEKCFADAQFMERISDTVIKNSVDGQNMQDTIQAYIGYSVLKDASIDDYVRMMQETYGTSVYE